MSWQVFVWFLTLVCHARALTDFSWKSKNCGGNSRGCGGDSCGHRGDSHGCEGDSCGHRGDSHGCEGDNSVHGCDSRGHGCDNSVIIIVLEVIIVFMEVTLKKCYL